MISWVEKYCCKEHPKRGLWQETMRIFNVPLEDTGDFLVMREGLLIRNQEIWDPGNIFPLCSCLLQGKASFLCTQFPHSYMRQTWKSWWESIPGNRNRQHKGSKEGHVQYNQETTERLLRPEVSKRGTSKPAVWTLASFIANWRTASWNREAPPSDSGFARTVWLLGVVEETRHGHGSVGSAGEIMVQLWWNLMVARTREL